MAKMTNKQRHEMASDLAEGSADTMDLYGLAEFYENAMYKTYYALSDKKLREIYEDKND